MKLMKFLLITGFVLFCLNKNMQAQNSNANNQTIDTKQQSIVAISAFTAIGNLTQLQDALNDGLNAGLTVIEIKEMLVQLYAYAGFPRSLNAINTLKSVLEERKKKGINDIEGEAPAQQVFSNTKYEYGKDVQTKLTGTTATGDAQKFVPIIDTFLKEHLFADIFSRHSLDYQTREIVTISALASMDGTESQLQSHLKVGKNVGLSEHQLRNLAATISTKISWQKGNTTSKMIDSVFNSKDNTATTQQDVQTNEIFPKGEKITNDNFTGTAYLQTLVAPDSLNAIAVGNVTFEPGARSKWHSHPAGQILLVIDGVGYYQEKGQPKKILRKGDTIKCPPNIPHWHGASADKAFVQVAITGREKGETIWLGPVTDKEYNSAE